MPLGLAVGILVLIPDSAVVRGGRRAQVLSVLALGYRLILD